MSMTLKSVDGTAELRLQAFNRMEDKASRLKSSADRNEQAGRYWRDQLFEAFRQDMTAQLLRYPQGSPFFTCAPLRSTTMPLGYLMLEYPEGGAEAAYDPSSSIWSRHLRLHRRVVSNQTAAFPCLQAGEHRRIVHGGGGHDEAVPDGILEAQLFPDVEDDAQRIDDAADRRSAASMR